MRDANRETAGNLEFQTRFIYLYLIDGIIFSSFGILLILTWPYVEVDPALFVIFFGSFSICHGVILLISCFVYRKEAYFKVILFAGCIGIFVGLCILLWPAGYKDVRQYALILFIAVWLILRGILHCYIPAKYNKTYAFILDRIYYIIGISELAFGIFLLFILKSHSFPLFWWIAIYFVSVGSVLSVFSLKYIGSSRQNKSD
jgi:uncharacterized membrane protein HdeD (DUF308 family)